jgi:hypothetical protein
VTPLLALPHYCTFNQVFKSSFKLLYSQEVSLSSIPMTDKEPCKKRPRHLCSLGTGEVIKILNYEALNPDMVDSFEMVIQGLARCLYSMEASVTDVRVCHPSCGKVVFIITFITKDAMVQFENGPQVRFEDSLKGKIAASGPTFSTSGTLMPAAHTLSSLLEYLKSNLSGTSHNEHNVRQVSKEMEK